ncbi:MAG: mRNA surveillance protein pelota [Candidatus Methanoplasma sp.]|jgi:protein pelota|nr:mRNA surveillance protein pelota [Candidatus Methanoplasma sp.]
MRVLGEDPKGEWVKMLPETDEDVWHLYNVLEEGDLVTASTTRREEKAADKVRAERAEKKRMTLGVRVEKIEFSDEDLRLRVLGTIESGPQDIGQHHTLLFEPGDPIEVSKRRWRDTQTDRIRKAVADSGKPRIAFVSLDQDEATIAVLRQFGLKEVATIRSMRSGKQYEEKERHDGYHGEILSKIAPMLSEDMPLVLIGPGFEKESLADYLKKSGVGKVHVHHTGHAGMTGVNEVMKGGMGSDILRESAVGVEMEAVERLMAELGKGGRAEYGVGEVAAAAAAGAVETLLILDSRLRGQDFDGIVRDVESRQGGVVVVSERHDGGRELAALGGMGAILRYKL